MPPQFFKMLMNAQDSSPGGGAATGASSAASPPAQGAATEQTPVTFEAIKGMFSEFRNGMFADTRKMVEGMIGKPGRGAAAAPASSSSHGSGSEAGERGGEALTTEQRFSEILNRRDALHGAIGGVKLSDGARARLFRAFEAEKPEDPAQWARQYLSDFGLSQQQEGGGANTTQSRAATAASPPGRPVSDAGAPSSPKVTEDTPLLRMSPEDRAHLIKTKGYTWFRQRLQQEMRGVQVTVNRR